MSKKRLKQRMEEYLLSGFGIPEGLKEQWLKLDGKEYQPSLQARIIYKIINGKQYGNNQ